METERINQLRNIFRLRYLNLCVITLVLIETYYVYIIIHNEKYLGKCFLSIENFVTVRKTNGTHNEFDMKTFASSFSSPYLIELIQNSHKDCLCCP